MCGSRCQYEPPTNRTEQPRWLQSLRDEREQALQKIGYAGGVFDRLLWTQTAYVQPQMHPYDRFFYDEVLHHYTVHRYLDDLQRRYGGIDAMLMWPTYTNIGVDDRNQFDYFRLMPGGLSGILRLNTELHARGVRVLWPYNPWDTGTRREAQSDSETLVSLLRETRGSGLNGDTLTWVPLDFWDAAAHLDYPVALQPEGGGTDAALNWSTMGWGYWDLRRPAPNVDRFKFLTRGKFMTNICDRWARRKVRHIQAAWFNGAGIESWENVWGIWNGIVPRDGEALRRVAKMLRFFGSEEGGGLLRSAEWEPHSLDVLQDGVFGSKWEGPATRLWTLVNTRDETLFAAHLSVSARANARFYDCYHGEELKPQLLVRGAPHFEKVQQLSFAVEGQGYGCVVQVVGEADPSLVGMLREMSHLTKGRPLSLISDEWAYLPQTMVEMPRTPPASAAPAGMVRIPAGEFSFEVRGLEIEGALGSGVDVQFRWEASPRREHAHNMSVDTFYIDRFPVTNAQYAEYLVRTKYRPSDARNWLLRWGASLQPPVAIANAPVTHVSLNEARLYCAWAHNGSRLPHTWEWQYAAQGADGRLYPWGNVREPDRYPVLHRGEVCPGPENVRAHSPAGDSPFGVADMVGNVWQYTDEFRDAHTRAVILRGGSNYRPVVNAGTEWYFPNRVELNTHNKYFLFDDAYERAGTVGFRCVVDAE